MASEMTAAPSMLLVCTRNRDPIFIDQLLECSPEMRLAQPTIDMSRHVFCPKAVRKVSYPRPSPPPGLATILSRGAAIARARVVLTVLLSSTLFNGASIGNDGCRLNKHDLDPHPADLS